MASDQQSLNDITSRVTEKTFKVLVADGHVSSLAIEELPDAQGFRLVGCDASKTRCYLLVTQREPMGSGRLFVDVNRLISYLRETYPQIRQYSITLQKMDEDR
jgi:hypothetical protein